MKLILQTCPHFFVEEDKILATLFDEGLDLLLLRKPDTEPIYSERLLTLLPEKYHDRVIVHDHFYLKDEFNLLGIHLNKANPIPPSNYNGPIARSCYSLKEVEEYKKECIYVSLKNIYDSISQPANKADFTQEQLVEATRRGIIDKDVMAQGGISLENIPEIRKLGFGGVIVSGDLWNLFDIHNGFDFKELIARFRRLRKATG